jgi:hypothetical protein
MLKSSNGNVFIKMQNSNLYFGINQLKLSSITKSHFLVLKNSLQIFLSKQRNSPQIKDWLQ